MYVFILVFFFQKILTYSCDIGYKKRKFLIGGNFSEVVNCDGSVVKANNFAIFDGSHWSSIGNGTNGRIRTSFIDSCLNVFIGGDFSYSSNIFTGPLSMLPYGSDTFQPVFNITFKKANFTPVVRSISVDCKNIPTSISKCDCDIYIGGKFIVETKTLSGNTIDAINLVKFSSKLYNSIIDNDVVNKGWDALGGYSAHGISYSDDVYVVNKRNFGIDLTLNKLYIGGDFNGGFLSYDLSTKNDNNFFENPLSDLNLTNIVVNDIFYDPVGFNLYYVIIVGKFNFSINTEKSEFCVNICVFNHDSKSWMNLPVINGTVYRVEVNSDDIIVSGKSFLKVIKSKYVNNWSANNVIWDDFVNENRTIKDFYVCSKVDLSCDYNSIAMIGDEGYVKFFKKKKNEFVNFGYGTNGEVESVSSMYEYYS